MLKGYLTNNVTLGTAFSAPKGVSVMALVAGDRRPLDAHDRAVQVSLDYAELPPAFPRIRHGSAVERVATGNLTAAVPALHRARHGRQAARAASPYS